MNWKVEAIEKLKEYAARSASLDLLKEQIATLKADITAMKHTRMDAMAVRGSGTAYRDDRLINALMATEEKKTALQITTRWVKIMDAALNQLTEEEYHILDVLFIHPQKGAINRLREELCLAEESSVYRRRDRAVRKFTLCMFGVTES